MKIVVFPSSFYPVNGGLQEATYRLSKEFKAKGHKTVLLTQRYPRSLKHFQVFKGIPVHRLLFPDLFLSSINWDSFLKYISRLMIAPISLFKLIFIFRNLKPDVIYLHFVGASSIYVIAALFCMDIKLIVSFHGDDVEGLPYLSRYHKWLFEKVCERANFVTACSEYLLDQAKIFCPSIRLKSLPIYNGISCTEYHNVEPYKHHRPYIFGAGRFVQKKGFDVLIKAYKIVFDNWRNIDLILAGEGEERKNYEKLADEISLRWCDKSAAAKDSDNEAGLIFWGWAGRHEMKSLLAGAEAFIVPSRKEPFGLVVLEGMALGVPVIASDVGGVSEIAGKDAAFLIKADDESELAGAIAKVIDDRELNIRLRNFGKLRAEKFSWSKAADNYLMLVKNKGE